MKKTILIVLVLALLAPVAAFAATEFSLGGFIKLDMFWDSTQDSKNAFVAIARNNDALFHHGNFNMTAQGSRFNFTIKGPKLWGATTTGFIEIDFDGLGDNNFSSVSGAVGNVAQTSPYTPRLRHAMFRLNWPDTELMLGQYWGLFSEFAPECTGDATFLFHGWTFQRQAQIRLTQKFAGDWTIAGAIMKPYDPSTVDSNLGALGVLSTPNPAASGGAQMNANTEQGRSSETPQLQGKLAFEKDLYGKAAFYGRPRGFVAQLNAGWQRTRYQANFAAGALNTFGQNIYGGAAVIQNGQQNLDPWCVQGTLFVPLIPTYSANLAGTASLTAEYFVGQGVSFLGAGRDNDNSWMEFSGRRFNGATYDYIYDRKLTQQFGGYLQGQYWFTNQWYMTAIWSFTKQYGIDQGSTAQASSATNPVGYKYASLNDQLKLWSEYNLTLWYRPIEAIKFGLTYAYERSDYLQKLNNPVLAGTFAAPVAVGGAQGQPAAGSKDFGESHRVQFVAYMFF